VAARRLDHDEPVALADQVAAVERELAQQRHARRFEVLRIVPVPDDAERIDVVERHVELDARLVEPEPARVATRGRRRGSHGHD